METIIITAVVAALLVIFAAILLGWAAEASEKFMAPGLALSILALLQTLPEYTVEAIIAWSRDTSLMIANLTGSLRLLMGFGWPMIFFIAAVSNMIKNKRPIKELELSPHQTVDIIALIPAVLYFVFIWYKGTMSPIDGLILIGMFIIYLFAVARARVSVGEELEDEDLPFVVKKIVHARKRVRIISITSLFVLGGIVIFAIAHPFVESLKTLAISLGVSQFLFIQWIAPFVSEFPEKTTAFIWASRIKKATTGMMNMVSSNLNQWMLLGGSLPIIFSISAGGYSTVTFNEHQREEILLTILQTGMVIAMMWNTKISWWKALLILALWIIGFFVPTERIHMIYVHLAAIIAILLGYAITQPRSQLILKFSQAFGKKSCKT